MRDAFDAALNWMFVRLDANKEGLIEFKRVNPMGIENQVWRDSWDSYFHANGDIADHNQGVASVDVQRVAYDALLDAADIYESYLHDPDRVKDLRARAERLRQQIMDIFWSDEKGGYFVLGTDRDQSGRLRQLKIRTSDMGHLLHSRLLRGDDQDISRRREATIRQLFSPEMVGLNGIRSLASDEIRYRPGAYHNGSVWIWNNYLITQGLVSHDYDRLADYVATKLLDDAQITRRFPEYLRGDNDSEHRLNATRVVVYDRRYKRLNVVEQPPQDIQAWSVAAILSIKLQNGKHSNSAQLNSQTDSSRNFEDEILSNLAK
jgi:glycogen debranching enzyme